MRAKYAKAIRFGIEKAREVKFWPDEGNYYEKESEVRYYDFRTEWNLASNAFNRTQRKLRKKYVDSLSVDDYNALNKAEHLDHRKWNETYQERYLREISERTTALEKTVRGLAEQLKERWERENGAN